MESTGENVVEVSEGDTVIPTFLSTCGDCTDCKSAKSNICTKLPFQISPWMSRYDSSRFKDLDGQVLYHFMFVSSFSEYTVVDEANVIKIDPALPPDRACLLSCGVSTGKNNILHNFHRNVIKVSNYMLLAFFRGWRGLENRRRGARINCCNFRSWVNWIGGMICTTNMSDNLFPFLIKGKRQSERDCSNMRKLAHVWRWFLQVAEGARLCRATRIIGVDVNPVKFEIGMLLCIIWLLSLLICWEFTFFGNHNREKVRGYGFCSVRKRRRDSEPSTLLCR